MYWTDRIRRVKIILVVSAVVIAGISLVASYALTNDLKEEEQRKVGIWAEAMRSLQEASGNTDLSMVLKVLESNHTIPVVVLDANGEVLDWRNIAGLRAATYADSLVRVKELATSMRGAGQTLRLDLTQSSASQSPAPRSYIDVCYGESVMLERLARYPFVQLGVVGLFVAVAIFALLSSKRAEQNRVWVGLSRETAHQLGTPISALMAWQQILRDTYPDDPMLPEMEGDLARLQLIAERFSKIGSRPELVPTDLAAVISETASYMRRRAPERVAVSFTSSAAGTVMVNLCAPLFQWVLENLCKNAMDAMPGGSGAILISLERSGEKVQILVKDTGKGISKKNRKNVFRPGFTTKKRGWGLGLSLAKRIVEEYHGGYIYVKDSQLGRGTTFCIELFAAPEDEEVSVQ